MAPSDNGVAADIERAKEDIQCIYKKQDATDNSINQDRAARAEKDGRTDEQLKQMAKEISAMRRENAEDRKQRRSVVWKVVSALVTFFVLEKIVTHTNILGG